MERNEKNLTLKKGMQLTPTDRRLSPITILGFAKHAGEDMVKVRALWTGKERLSRRETILRGYREQTTGSRW